MSDSSDFKTILVLDDDPQFHKLVEPVLTGRGHRVLSAHRGSEGKQVIEREPRVDLVVVDGQLPDTTGIEWIADLRACGFASLVMFVSAYWRDAGSYHKLTKELAVSLVLHKPIIASVFAAEVDILLGRGGALESSNKQDVEDTLLALRAEYARDLPQHLEELQALLKQLLSHPENQSLIGEARVHAHKLRGTAASYGFKEIGDLAGTIEEAIIALPRTSAERDRDIENISATVSKTRQLAQSAAREVEEKLTRPRALEALPEQAPQPGAVARILVIDDDAAFLDLVDQLAREHQLEIVRASNASEGLEMACMHQVDGALIDVDLGSRDAAFKLASDLRLLPGYESLPLGFLSGAGHIEEVIQVDNVGQCLFFNRPTRADALEAAVRQLTAIRQAVRPRVLVIDDDPDFLKRTAFVLSHEGLAVRTLQETTDVLDEMRDFVPDILLLDVMMPGVSGFDLCRMLRTMPRWRDLPVVFLTAYTDIETRLACLRCGGDDCLVKPVVNEELLLRLHLRLDRALLLRDRLEHDNVTGLLRRTTFMQQLAGMIAEARRQEWAVSVCLLEMSVPQESHGAMDSLLGLLGNLLLRRLRTEVLKGRFGDNRFLLAFRQEEKPHIEMLLARIAQEFSATRTLAVRGGDAAGLSYALSCYPEDGANIHELLSVAVRRLRAVPPVGSRKSVG